MPPLQAKFGKICQWTKKIKRAVVYGCGREIVLKTPKESKNSLNVSTACLFKKIDAQYAFTGSARKPRENLKALNIDSRSGAYEGFPTPLFSD